MSDIVDGQCPKCGRMRRDWGTENRVENERGTKLVALGTEDRLSDYRAFRRTEVNSGAVTDFDQVEWRYRDGIPRPVALLELTRVDGGKNLPATYLQAVLDRFTKRDAQGELAKKAAEALQCKAWIVCFRWDLSEFWVYNLTDSRGWWHLSSEAYRKWLLSL